MSVQAKKYKLRPLPLGKTIKANQSDAFVAYLSYNSLLQLKIKDGDACSLWQEGGSPKRTIIVSKAPEKLQDTVVQTSTTLQHCYKLSLGDPVFIEKKNDEIHAAKLVSFEHASDSGEEPISPDDIPLWELLLQKTCFSTSFLCPGMLIEVQAVDERRKFKISSIRATRDGQHAEFNIGSTPDLARFGRYSTKVRISQGDHSFPPLRFVGDTIGGLREQVQNITYRLAALENNGRFPKQLKRFGFFLHGPSGTGKSLIISKIVSSSWGPGFSLDRSRAVGRYVGESKDSISKLFAQAKSCPRSIIILDQLDEIAPAKDEHGIGSILCDEIDQLHESDSMVLILAAARRPNDIYPSLRSVKRLSIEIEFPTPSPETRAEILGHILGGMNYDPGILMELSGRTHGFVGSDLEFLVQEACAEACMRLKKFDLNTSGNLDYEDSQNRGQNNEVIFQDALQLEDFERSLRGIRPSVMRDLYLETPKVQWTDIGGQSHVKKILQRAVEWPLKYPTKMQKFGIRPKTGVLLYGPPGCSKTLTARALATEAGLNFISVKGAELINMYVGESERAIRDIFSKARAASPSIIFFDEIDAIASARGGRGNGLNVVTTLLTEMDGMQVLKGVMVLAATNKPELLDPALLRPGRLDSILYVGPPDLEARKETLEIKMKQMAIAESVDVDRLARITEGYTGAEIVNICEEAGQIAFTECIENGAKEEISMLHFEEALKVVKPQISEAEAERYGAWSVGSVKKL